jgi:hypothetical protein
VQSNSHVHPLNPSASYKQTPPYLQFVSSHMSVGQINVIVSILLRESIGLNVDSKIRVT